MYFLSDNYGWWSETWPHSSFPRQTADPVPHHAALRGSKEPPHASRDHQLRGLKGHQTGGDLTVLNTPK